MIREFAVSNFKSIEYTSLTFAGTNFVVGKNGTGKSNLVDALLFLSECSTTPLQMVLNKRGGSESVFRRVPAHEIETTGIRAALARPSLRMAMSITFPPMAGKKSQEGHYAIELQPIIIGRHSIERSVVVRREQAIVIDGNGERHFFERTNQGIKSSDSFLSSLPANFIEKNALAIPILGGFTNFRLITAALQSVQSYSIDPAKLREFQDPDTGDQLLSDGSNAVSVLEEIKRLDKNSLERIFELLSAITPGTIAVTSSTAGRKRFLRFLQQWGRDKRFRFDAFNMSDGTLRAFGLLLASFQPNAPDFMIIEQPEDSMHPGATAVILDALRTRSLPQQTVITTHSPEVLDQLDPSSDEIFVTALNDGVTQIAEIDQHLIEGVRQDLCTGGDLLRLRQLENIYSERVNTFKATNFFKEI